MPNVHLDLLFCEIPIQDFCLFFYWVVVYLIDLEEFAIYSAF